LKILVTGGAGFIGSHVVDIYLNEGHQVIALDDLSTGRRENVNPRAKLVVMDIRDKRLRELLEAERPEVVNHHAAQMNVRISVAEPLRDADINILGTLNLLESAVAAGTRRFIFASTGGAIYGEQEYFPADETHPTRPVSPYAISKRAAELYIDFFRRAHGLETVILRYANVYGPRQNPFGEAGVVAIFATAMSQGRSPTIFGDGRQTRDFVYVGDVAQANKAALTCPSGEIFNIGTGKETSVEELYRMIAESMQFEGEPIWAEPKAGDLQRSCLSADHAAQVLGWRPEVELSKGLSLTLNTITAGSAP